MSCLVIIKESLLVLGVHIRIPLETLILEERHVCFQAEEVRVGCLLQQRGEVAVVELEPVAGPAAASLQTEGIALAAVSRVEGRARTILSILGVFGGLLTCATAIMSCSTESVRTGEGSDVAVIQAHAVEDAAQMALRGGASVSKWGIAICCMKYKI